MFFFNFLIKYLKMNLIKTRYHKYLYEKHKQQKYELNKFIVACLLFY